VSGELRTDITLCCLLEGASNASALGVGLDLRVTPLRLQSRL
jgi:hypothetical protein